VRTTLAGVDVVHKGKDVFVVPIVILKRNLAFRAVSKAFDINDILVNGVLALTQIFDEGYESPLELEFMCLGLRQPFIDNRYLYSLVEECQFPEPGRKNFETEISSLEYCIVRKKAGHCSPFIAIANHLHRLFRNPSQILLEVYVAISMNIHLAPGRKCIDN